MKYSCQRKGVSLDNTRALPRSKVAQHYFMYRLHKRLYRVHYIAGEHGSGMAAHKSIGPDVDVSICTTE